MKKHKNAFLESSVMTFNPFFPFEEFHLTRLAINRRNIWQARLTPSQSQERRCERETESGRSWGVKLQPDKQWNQEGKRHCFLNIAEFPGPRKGDVMLHYNFCVFKIQVAEVSRFRSSCQDFQLFFSFPCMSFVTCVSWDLDFPACLFERKRNKQERCVTHSFSFFTGNRSSYEHDIKIQGSWKRSKGIHYKCLIMQMPVLVVVEGDTRSSSHAVSGEEEGGFVWSDFSSFLKRKREKEEEEMERTRRPSQL